MSQKKKTPEEREQRNKEIEEKTAALEKELLALFDAGLPLCYSDSCDPLNDFSVFRGLSAEWDKAIDTLLKEASYLDDIFLPSLISEHLRDLPEETSVYMICDINLAFMGWVVGDMLTAQKCLSARVSQQIGIETDPANMIMSGCHEDDISEEQLSTVDVINNSYGIKKLDTGKNATFTYNVMGGNRLSDEEWEQIKYNPHIEMEE